MAGMSEEREQTYRVVGVWGDGDRLILFQNLSELDAALTEGTCLC